MTSQISKYSNGAKVSDAQYITELICENYARKKRKDLHYRFWVEKTWAKFYRSQIGSANKLLKTYEAKDIIAALLSEEGKRIFSLRAPHLPAIIEKFHQINKSKNQELHKPVERSKDSKGVQSSKKTKNMLDRLKELE